jgi:RNA polymerase sigma-70 factor (ECF subfamily)
MCAPLADVRPSRYARAGMADADESNAPDAALVAALVVGDRDALAELYRRHGGTLLAVALRILGDRAEAEEIVHDVFVEAWRQAVQYDPARGSARAWLVTRARSRALDRVKAPARARRVAVESAPEPVAAEADPSDASRVQRALASLPAEQRAVLELGYFEGLSSTEIAARLDIPVGTVKSRVAAALQRLRALLSAVEGEC